MTDRVVEREGIDVRHTVTSRGLYENVTPGFSAEEVDRCTGDDNKSSSDKLIVATPIQSKVSGINQVKDLKEFGTVISIGDGIAKVQAREMVEFNSGFKGIALNLETDNVGIVVLGSDREI